MVFNITYPQLADIETRSRDHLQIISANLSTLLVYLQFFFFLSFFLSFSQTNVVPWKNCRRGRQSLPSESINFFFLSYHSTYNYRDTAFLVRKSRGKDIFQNVSSPFPSMLETRINERQADIDRAAISRRGSP